MPPKNPQPDSPTDEKGLAPPDIDDRGTPVAPSPPKRMRRAMRGFPAPLTAILRR